MTRSTGGCVPGGNAGQVRPWCFRNPRRTTAGARPCTAALVRGPSLQRQPDKAANISPSANPSPLSAVRMSVSGSLAGCQPAVPGCQMQQ